MRNYNRDIALTKTETRDGLRLYSFIQYLREGWVNKSCVIALNADNTVAWMYLNSNRYGTVRWTNGVGLGGAQLWESADKMNFLSYAASHYPILIANGPANLKYARSKIIPDILDDFYNRKLAAQILRILRRKKYDSPLEMSDYDVLPREKLYDRGTTAVNPARGIMGRFRNLNVVQLIIILIFIAFFVALAFQSGDVIRCMGPLFQVDPKEVALKPVDFHGISVPNNNIIKDRDGLMYYNPELIKIGIDPGKFIPVIARRRNIGADVFLEVRISPRGKVEHVKVTGLSLTTELGRVDYNMISKQYIDAAFRAVHAARFTLPEKGGKTDGSILIFPLRFRIE